MKVITKPINLIKEKLFSSKAQKEFNDILVKQSSQNQSSIIGVWMFIPKTQEMLWNDDMFKLLEFDNDILPTFDLTTKYIIPESKPLFFESFNKCLAEGISWEIDLKLVSEKGKKLWLKSKGEPILRNGKIIRLSGIFLDISIVKEAKYSTSLFNSLINEANEAILVSDTSGAIIFANNVASSMFALSKNELLNLNIQDIDSNFDDNAKWQRFLADLKEKRILTFEYNFLNTEGVEIPIEQRSNYTELDGNSYVVSYISNISDRRQVEQKIRKSVERQRVLSEISYLLNSGDSFDFKIRETLRISGNYLNVNRAFIFEDILNGKASSNTFEWCNKGNELQRKNMQAIPYTLFPSWKESISKKGYIEDSTELQMDEEYVSIFKPYQASTLLMMPLLIDFKYYGFIGIAVTKTKRTWTIDEREFLETLSNILSNSFEQKLSIDALKKSEKRFREFAELLPEIVLETSINGKVTFANNLACERFGITSESLSKGTVLYSLFTDDDEVRAWEYFERKIQGEDLENEEFKVNTREGKIMPVIVYANIILRDLLPIGLRAVMVDITERKKAEEQIISLAKFSEESPYPVLRVDKNGDVSYCNKKGVVVKDFIEQNYDNSFKELFKVIFSNNIVEDLEINILGNYFNLTLTPIKNYINVYGKDITQKKIDEERLRLSEQRFRDVTDAAGEYIWEIDRHFKFTYISDRVFGVLGYEPKELIGKMPFDVMSEDESERVQKLVRDYSQRGESFKNLEHQAITKSGKVIWQMVSGIPIFDGARKFFGFRGTVMDITERKKYEDGLQEARQIAEQASKVKADFLSTMSHEIRTPMNAVIGLTHILLQDDPRPEQLDSLKALRFSAENLLVLINDILDFSKIEAGKISFEEIDFNIEELAKGIKGTFIPSSEEKGISINLNISPEMPRQLNGDPVRLAQILNNLVGNAVKFTELGSVEINITPIAKQIDYVVVNIEVVDTGIGIAEENLEMIFNSFTQASSDITRKFGGTGLGLAISKKLVEMQGGLLKVESKLNIGSKFHFYLRYKMGDQNVITDSTTLFSGHFESLKGIKVLIVEDNQINQVVARKFLQKWDVEFDMAENGKKAVEMVQLNNYDMVLMDIQMPVMDGYEATKTIRNLEDEKYKTIPIIALTASVLLEIHNKIVSAGMNDYLIKPFNPSELYSKIKKFTKK